MGANETEKENNNRDKRAPMKGRQLCRNFIRQDESRRRAY